MSSDLRPDHPQRPGKVRESHRPEFEPIVATISANWRSGAVKVRRSCGLVQSQPCLPTRGSSLECVCFRGQLQVALMYNCTTRQLDISKYIVELMFSRQVGPSVVGITCPRVSGTRCHPVEDGSAGADGHSCHETGRDPGCQGEHQECESRDCCLPPSLGSPPRRCRAHRSMAFDQLVATATTAASRTAIRPTV